MPYNPNPFKEKIIDEFCGDLYRIMGSTIADYRIMYAKHGAIFDAECDDVLNKKGPSGLRYHLKHKLARLSYIFKRCHDEGEDWMDSSRLLETVFQGPKSLILPPRPDLLVKRR